MFLVPHAVQYETGVSSTPIMRVYCCRCLKQYEYGLIAVGVRML